MRQWVGLTFWLAACATEEAPTVQDPCALAFLPAPGPLAEEAKTTDPVTLAQVRIREARLTGDPGFDTLAELALGCALSRDPGDVEARRWMGHVELQFHRFAAAEARMEGLLAETGNWRDAMFLGDARMEQGDLAGAGEAYDQASAARSGLELSDRMAWLAWLQGDLERAITLETLAASAASPADPEPMAWVMTRLGVLKSLRGEMPNEIGIALTLLPDYRPAHLALGRFLVVSGHPEKAAEHLRKAGPTIEAGLVSAELDPTVSIEALKNQDRRGYGLWLARTDPAAAVVLLDQELAQRKDATTRIARAWAASRTGADTKAEVEDALRTGIADPSVLLLAAEVLRDPALAERALATPNGLLPSERARALAVAKPAAL